MSSSAESFLARVRSEFPADFLTTEPSELKEYGKDWTKVFQPDPLAIAFPRSTEEVSQLMKLCHEYRIPVVPSGGRTGLAGGAVAARKELVLSLQKMNRMEEVDPLSRTLRVQAGAITEAVHEHCHPYGLTWPIDFASKGSSCVGGNIATNAGGVNVIRYGLTRQWVLGLQVVTASGDILELNGALEKNNTGTDLRQLFIGTEGTLGIITQAVLKLAPLPGQSEVLLFAVQDLSAVLEVFRQSRASGFTLNAFEFFTDVCLSRVRKHLGLKPPFSTVSPYYVLVDLETPSDAAALENWLTEILSTEGVLDGVMAQNPRESDELWALRETISESLSATGLPHKNDVSLPIAQLGPFCEALETFFTSHYPGWEICNFGHIGDGNLHINIMKPDDLSVEEFRARTKQVDRDMFELIRKNQGSISAEHGIGLLKKDFLHYTRSSEELTLLRSVKLALDPNGLLNPGKIFDLPT